MSAENGETDIVALILSFFIPGAGQLYQGRTKVGAVFLAAFLVSVPLTFVLIGLVLVPIVWIVNMYDVYTQRFEL